MRSMKRVFWTFLFLVPASLVMATASQQVRPAAAAEGGADVQAKYDKMCKSCHAENGKGNPVKAKILKIDAAKVDLTREEATKMSRDDMKKILLGGKDKMPAFEKKLAPEEVDPMLDLVQKLQKGS